MAENMYLFKFSGWDWVNIVSQSYVIELLDILIVCLAKFFPIQLIFRNCKFWIQKQIPYISNKERFHPHIFACIISFKAYKNFVSKT